MKKIQLLYPFSRVAGIFFPVGKPENDGTCQFYSTKCLLACAAIHCVPNEFKKIGHETKKGIYDFIIYKPIFQVLDKIISELKEMNCKILYWFACGDCMQKDENRIIKIIDYLNGEGIIQCGFTRNKDFWQKIKRYTNIALTLETYAEVQKTQSYGLFAIPDYKKNVVKIYIGKYYSGSCGQSVYVYKSIKREANCLECFKQEQGCFAEIEKGEDL